MSLEEVFSKVVAIFLGCILMFILPVKIMYERQENLCQTYALTESIALIDSVCNKGIIYQDVYLSFLDSLNRTGKIMEVELEHYSESEGRYTKQIVSELENSGEYKMQIGDLIKIKVNDEKGDVIIFYGGYIKDEDY